MNNINIEISKKDLLGILSEYFTDKLGKEITVNAKCSKGYEGLWEIPCTDVEFSYNKEVNIGAFKANKTSFISIDEIKEILSEKLQGYDITYIHLKTGMRSVGYWDREDTPYFNGVELELREKQAKLVRI